MADTTLLGCKKKKEAKPHLRLGLEPEVVQILYKNALSDEGIGSFVRTRQAAIYALMYYMSTSFEEVKELELKQIGKKGVSMELLVYKGKKNQTRQLQRVVIHPNSMSHTGKTCLVALLDDYLALCHSLGHNGENDYIFPLVGAKKARIKPSDFIAIHEPIESITYNVYRKHLKQHLDCEALKELGVYPADYSTHSF